MALGDLNDPATIIIIALVVVIVIIICAMVILTMRNRPKKPRKDSEPESDLRDLPFRISKSIQSNEASHAKDELRILDLERDILSDALRRLYEAHAEGKISEQERDRLAATYKSRMTTVKDSIAKDETIVALHELESMQEDLMKLFSERFGDITSKVDELRSRIDIKPIKEIKIAIPETQPTIETEEEFEEEEETAEGEKAAAKPKKKRKPPAEKPAEKTEAEKRIDEIRSEVEKVLDKLGQMEVET